MRLQAFNSAFIRLCLVPQLVSALLYELIDPLH